MIGELAVWWQNERVLDRLQVRERADDVARAQLVGGLAAIRELESPVDAVAPLDDVARD